MAGTQFGQPGSNESQRSAALRRYAILDTPSDPAFDRITAMVAQVFDIPIVLFTLVDTDRVWAKSAWGLTLPHPMSYASFCRRVVAAQGPLTAWEPDLPPMPTSGTAGSEPSAFRFYAGMPVCSPDGVAVGTLCMIDVRRRTLSPGQERTLAGFASLLRDELELRLVTERAGADRQLAAPHERYYRQLVESLDDVVGVLSHDGVYLTLTPSVASLTGFAPHELIGKPWHTLVHVEDREQLVAATRALLAGDRMEPIEWRLARKDGTHTLVESRTTWVRDGAASAARLLVIIRDITKRKRAEEAVQLRDRVVAASPIGIVICDPTRSGNPIVYANGSVERATGYGVDELIGSHPCLLYGPETDQATAGQIDHAMHHGHACRAELLTYRKDGSPIWVDWMISPVLADDGSLTHSIGMLSDITDRKAAEQALRESEARYRILVDGLPDSVVVTVDDTIVYVNPAAVQLTGTDDADQLSNTTVNAFILPSEQPIVKERLEHARPTCHPSRVCEVHLLRRDGRLLNVEIACSSISYDGKPATQMIIRDITAKKQAEAARRQFERDYHNLFESARDAILIIDPENEVVLDVNERGCDMYGLPRSTFVGTSMRDLSCNAERGQEMIEVLLSGGTADCFESVHRHANGSQINMSITSSLVDWRGRKAILSINRDVTVQHRLERQLEHQAFHDQLTGLPNRALFMDRLGHALERDRRHATWCAVLLLDLDRFKVVNESLGHGAGDDLLVTVAQRLSRCLRPGDTVARFGGDEFTILLEDIQSVEDAIVVAHRVSEALRLPVTVGDHELYITTSLGIVVSSGSYTIPADLVRDADIAMYRAKARGPGRFEVYETAMNGRAIESLALESDLRRAIERREFVVYYQPQVALQSCQIVGVEALVRWQHPTRGLVSPAQFIPLAEETGLIVPIGQLVLEAACLVAQHWQRLAATDRCFVVCVNLSVGQLLHPGLVDMLATLLREYNLPTGCLELEITESMMMDDVQTNIATLQKLKRLGIRLAVDDFGTGYSSLSYLKQFPVDRLKIDRSFIAGLGQDEGAGMLARAVISLAHSLHLDVVAEGIERVEHVTVLRELGCEYGQGFLFARPMPRDSIPPPLTVIPAG